MPPILIESPDHHLFLFNQPGKCARLVATPGADEPFKLEAVFTHNLPNTSDPTRIWLDPSGRICMTYDKNQLLIMFPEGRIPPEIAQKMPADQLDDQSPANP
jgi:hypothetical protein